MSIEKHTFELVGKTGTYNDFGAMSLVETQLTATLPDGREIEVNRSALGAPTFQIRVEGVDLHMRFDLTPVIQDATAKLVALIDER